MAETADGVTNRQVFGLLLVGMGVFAAPLQATGFYLPIDLPRWLVYGLAVAFGLAGGAMMTRTRRVAAMIGGVSAAVTGTVSVLGYLALWSLWTEREHIFEIEMLVPGILAGFVGFVAFGVASRLLEPPAPPS